jgi:hypothetical protein
MISVFLLSVMGGCGGDAEGRRAISGTVTLDGVPLEEGSIGFEPVERSKISSGAMISKGNYSIARQQGLPPGKYRVEIHAVKPGTGMKRPPGGGLGSEKGTPAVELIPASWNRQSEHFIEVTASGPAVFTHEIVTKEKR